MRFGKKGYRFRVPLGSGWRDLMLDLWDLYLEAVDLWEFGVQACGGMWGFVGKSRDI